MKRTICFILAVIMAMTLLCCEAFADTDTADKADVPGYKAEVHQLYSGYKDEVYKTTDFGGHEIRSDAHISTPEEYRQYMSRFYDDDIADEFADRFDRKVFDEYVVFVNTLYQGCGTSPMYSVKDVLVTKEDTTVYGTWNYREDTAYADIISVLFVEVLIPKEKFVSGNYSVVWAEDKGGESFVYGDIDKDGRVSLRDSMKIQRSCIGLEKLDDISKLCADVNRDGKVTNGDAIEVQRYCINVKTSACIGTAFCLLT